MANFTVPIVLREHLAFWMDFHCAKAPTAIAKEMASDGRLTQTEYVRADSAIAAAKLAEKRRPGYVAIRDSITQHEQMARDIGRMDGPPKIKLSFEIVRSLEGGWFVLATKSNGLVERFDGFHTEQEARSWIKYKSYIFFRRFWKQVKMPPHRKHSRDPKHMPTRCDTLREISVEPMVLMTGQAITAKP